jgi:hypothetical protein
MRFFDLLSWILPTRPIIVFAVVAYACEAAIERIDRDMAARIARCAEDA